MCVTMWSHVFYVTFMLVLLLITCSAHTGKQDRDDQTPLDEYVWKWDPHYSWQLLRTMHGHGVTFYTLNMTSQLWQPPDVVDHSIWYHYLTVIVPDVITRYNIGTLIIGGDDNHDDLPTMKDEYMIMGSMFAASTGTVVAYLQQVPNQPIKFFDDPYKDERREDAAIAWTWHEFYYGRRGPEFLLRMPMTKAAVRAMDAIQEFTQTLGQDLLIDKFFITGASKRGWTTWTTAAVDDERVVAFAPLVLSCLNFVENLNHHYMSYGGWSFALDDYWELNITMIINEPGMQEMMDIIDPYAYKDRYTMPKLYIGAAGDEFFRPDDSYFFWNDLPEPKYIRLFPNAEHTLLTRILEVYKTLRNFWMAVSSNHPLPKFSWERETNATHGSIILTSEDTPLDVTVFYADTFSKTRRDFRLAKPASWNPDQIVIQPVFWWRKKPIILGDNQYKAEFEIPEEGWFAFLIEVRYPGVGDWDLTFSTEIQVIPEEFPFARCSSPEICRGVLL